MILLDLFCGGGGAMVGYRRAGWEVIGCDHQPQPTYHAPFTLGDWREGLERHFWRVDAIHASPPCQAFVSRAHPGAPDLIEEVRAAITATGLPFVIENVPTAPLRRDLLLCGSMFGLGIPGRQLRRHRIFEMSHAIPQPECRHEGDVIGVYGHQKRGPTRKIGWTGTTSECCAAMGITLPRESITQAIPPAYTAYIGSHLLLKLGAK